MKDIAIILGSARSDGNTKRVVDLFLEFQGEYSDLFDLNDYNIDFFDYDKTYSEDQYIELCANLNNYKFWIFATPVYWYSMSAMMKNFFDRIKDLMDDREDLILEMRNIHMGIISCGATENIPDFFAEPIRLTAGYLNMGYVGHVHTWTDRKGRVQPQAVVQLKQYATKLTNRMVNI